MNAQLRQHDTQSPVGWVPTIVPSVPSIADARVICSAPDRRPRSVSVFAATASLTIAAAAFGSFVHMAGKSAVASPRPMMVVEMTDLQTPPPPPPPPPEAKVQVAEIAPPSIVVPEPIVATPSAVPTMATVEAAAPPAVETSPTGTADAAPTAAPPAAGPTEAGDLSAKMVSAKPPSYPLESRRQHEQGTVVLAVLLSAEGRVAEVAVSRSSGFRRLDDAALNAVRRWRWSPMVRDGFPVLVRGLVTIPFILNG